MAADASRGFRGVFSRVDAGRRVDLQVGRIRGCGFRDIEADAREAVVRAQVRQGGNNALGDVHQVRITTV